MMWWPSSALLDHLWQSTLVALVAGLITLALSQHQARIRYWLWIAASIKFLLPLSVLVRLGERLQWQEAPRRFEPLLTFVMDQALTPIGNTIGTSAAQAETTWSPSTFLMAVWLAGTVTLVVKWHRDWRAIRAAVRTGALVHISGCEAAGLDVRCSPLAVEPGVVGICRPVLLLPPSTLNDLSADQLRGLLAHERCHVQAHDNLFGAIHMVVATIFWFHPLVWWIGGRLVDERERACDEEVLQLGIEARDYAEGILRVCRRSVVQSSLPCVAGAGGARLRKRIEQILRGDVGRPLRFSGRSLLLLLFAIAVLGPIGGGALRRPVLAQAALATPTFEVASIRATDPGATATLGGCCFVRYLPGGRIAGTAVSLMDLVVSAYRLQYWQVSGGPEWTDPNMMSTKDRYNVEARAAATATPDQQRLMLQALLAERFQLRVRRETRSGKTFDLVVDRGGPKLESVQISNYDGLRGSAGGGRLTVSQITMVDLATQLQGYDPIHAPVTDRTGLTGVYRLSLVWTPERFRISGNAPAVAGGEPSIDPNGPGLLTALREQLGLRLVETTGPIEHLRIESAERPTAN